MKTVLLVVAGCLVVGLGGWLIFKSTEGDRAENARKTLERAADEFVTCYGRSSSYEKCETGSSKIAVTLRRRREFGLSATVEFGPTYTISRYRAGAVQRTCQPKGSHCPVEDWSLQR
jgi:hypothetical protein